MGQGWGCRKVEDNSGPGGAPDFPEVVPLLSPWYRLRVKPCPNIGKVRSVWYHHHQPADTRTQGSPWGQAHLAQSPPSLIHCHTQEAHLKIHRDVLKLEFPVQVQLQKDGAHIWKDTKARNFRAETIYLPRLREIRNPLTDFPISLSKRRGTSTFLLTSPIQDPMSSRPHFLPTVTWCL